MNASKSTNTELNETLIIQHVLNGEINLFEVLMRRYNQLLYRSIRSYVDAEKDVEDIMQDTYIKAFEKLYQFKHDARFSTWLVRIGINEALQRKRKIKYQAISLHQEDKVLQIEDRTIMNPEHKTMHIEYSNFMEKAIDELPEKYKIVYMLKEVEGLGISEISTCLDLTKSNVKVRLHRARTMLKDSLLSLTGFKNIFEFGDTKCDRIVANVMDYLYKRYPKI